MENNYLQFDNTNKINCHYIWYLDYNRFKFAQATDVESPQDVWAIDFWYKTSTNQAVKERTDYDLSNGNNNNFNEFIIDWNYHIRVRVKKIVESEVDSTFSYEVKCSPLVVLEHPDLDSPEYISKNVGDVHYLSLIHI